MYTLNITLEVWDPDEISDGVFSTTLTHPLFGGKLTFLSGSEEEADAFIKNLKNQFHAKYQEQQQKIQQSPAAQPGSYSQSQRPADDWKRDVVDIVNLAVTLGKTLNRNKEKESDRDNRPGPKRPSF